MEIKFKPKFWKDINLYKNDREIMSALYRVFINVEKANRASEISNFKELKKYNSRCRIKIKLDQKRDFRIGIYVHGRIIWFARFLHRRKIYDENW